jgi:hypothetical protein
MKLPWLAGSGRIEFKYQRLRAPAALLLFQPSEARARSRRLESLFEGARKRHPDKPLRLIFFTNYCPALHIFDARSLLLLGNAVVSGGDGFTELPMSLCRSSCVSRIPIPYETHLRRLENDRHFCFSGGRFLELRKRRSAEVECRKRA